jgi:hypothetical protein
VHSNGTAEFLRCSTRLRLGGRCGGAAQLTSRCSTRLRPLFMGLLVPDCSREKVRATLSLTELNPALVGEKSRRRRIPFGYDFVSSSGMTAGDDAVRAGPAGPLHRAWRGQAGQLGRAGGGKRMVVGPGSASGRVSAHSQFCYLKFLFFFQICL